jgi:hypothetical protein
VRKLRNLIELTISAWSAADTAGVHTASLHLNTADRVRYFAPIAFCAFLAALCLALIITSAFLTTVRDALAIAAAGAFGLLVCAALGATFLRVQLRNLRYLSIPTSLTPLASFEAVRRLMQRSGWHIVESEPGRRIEARTSDSLLHHGEIVAVEFQPNEVLIASISDPSVGFSLVGQRRCQSNMALVRRAVTSSIEKD